jgi:hypothetical protein
VIVIIAPFLEMTPRSARVRKLCFGRYLLTGIFLSRFGKLKKRRYLGPAGDHPRIFWILGLGGELFIWSYQKIICGRLDFPAAFFCSFKIATM